MIADAQADLNEIVRLDKGASIGQIRPYKLASMQTRGIHAAILFGSLNYKPL